jgi:glycerol-3-phosphate dehydrogenase
MPWPGGCSRKGGADLQDLLVIGGGINGVGIARDAAGRGMSVTLCEKDDFASHTSSASTKLVHGGLRYLEYYEFRLVAEALREREVLLKAAPHIIWPLRFVLPHDKGLRPGWMLRLGLALYDTIGGRRSLPGSRGVDLTRPPHCGVLQDRLTRGFEYSDCWVEDARLVVLCAMDARDRGAQMLSRTECVALERLPSHWRATLRSGDGATRVVEARALANAAGPWVDRVARSALGEGTPAHLRLVKGSHIIVPRKYPGEHAYIFQNGDGRVVFAIPYERDFTLIGTTDQLFEGDLDSVAISAEEVRYLREAAGEYFAGGIAEDEIVATYAGVRPLYEDDSARNSTVTRDYAFELEDRGGAPILSVYGGKITTFRKLAEHALDRLAPQLPQLSMGTRWTRDAPLPGGEMEDFAAFLWRAGERFSWMPPEMLLRLARAYGTRIDKVIGTADGLDRMGDHFGGDLYEAELRYLVKEEFARTAQDILWRRSKLGLHLPAETERRVADWLEKEGGDSA